MTMLKRRPMRLAMSAAVVALLAAGAVTAGLAAQARGATATTAAGPATAAAPAKGVGAWVFSGVRKSLITSGASWYYTWGAGHAGIGTPHGVQFVPMIWGPGSVTKANLKQVKGEGRYLLGFNEPDNAGQSDMSVSKALSLWPKLMSTGMKLGSPAVAANAATAGSWLARFMKGAKARGYRVNFITVHWYGGDFTTSAAVGQLRSYLVAIHARYHLPLWLTEFALIRFGSTVTFASARQQAAFVTSATKMISKLGFVQRYAWFALPATTGDGTAGLFRPGALATRAGRAFEAAG
jgi:hypothetical protein